MIHREDAPALIGTDGTKAWYRNGQLHREDGPAVEWANGSKEWWVDGEQVVEPAIGIAPSTKIDASNATLEENNARAPSTSPGRK
ncbi:hypothetical protein GCM10028812_49480 [Ancylobacter sonchi]